MKKIFSLFISIIIFIACLTSCNLQKERKISDAKEIAENVFHAQEILCIGNCNGLKERYGMSDKYFMLVIGKTEMGEITVLVPANSRKPASFLEWPLNYSFEEITAKIKETLDANSYYGEDYEFFFKGSALEDYYRAKTGKELPEFDHKFAIVFDKRYMIYEYQSEIVIVDMQNQLQS